MKFCEQNVEIFNSNNPLQLIERCGRVCYKSNSDYSDDSSEKFYKKLITNKHFAMLEHATFCFRVNRDIYDDCSIYKYIHRTAEDNDTFYISGNLRAFNETQDERLLKALFNINPVYVYSDIDIEEEPDTDITAVNILSEDVCANTKREHTYLTLELTTNRAIANELVRHREMSYAQVSTRYVNYAKNDMIFIRPSIIGTGSELALCNYILACNSTEKCYKTLVSNGIKPEIARDILPLGLATEIVVTGNLNQWKHILDQRYYGTTGKPHPAMKELMYLVLLKYQYIEGGLHD